MFIQSQDDSHCCYSFLIKVVILMMKLKYPICCGLDVHKNVIVATIVITNKDGISEYRQKSFSTINSDIQRFHNWLIENHCYRVCMESTGKYWIPIFNYLENDMDVCLTHPKYVKAIKGKKTDKKDSKWIADLYKFDLARCSFIPPKDFRQLRELARYRFKLVCMKSSEKNRIQNCMAVSNVGIASVLSDPFGKTATEIMSYLPEHTADSIDEKAVRIAKAGNYLKPMMVQCALAAIKNKKQPYFAVKYGRIKKRRGHKKAITAIARMMMVCIYHMVSEKKPFTPTDYEELMNPQEHVARVVLNENNVFAYLESLGYDSSKLVKRNDN